MESAYILNREAISRQDGCNIPNEPVLAIRGYLCIRCWKPSNKMTKCAGCLRVYYCSKACQKLDWDLQHKKHCKILRQMKAVEEAKIVRSRSWKQYQESLWMQLDFIKRKSSDACPRDAIQGQPYCSTCYRSGIQAAALKVSLVPCDICHMIFTCGDCQPSHPEEQCLEYQDRNEVELFRVEHFESSGKLQCHAATGIPRKTYRSLSTAANWVEYMVYISDKDFLELFVGQDIDFFHLRGLVFPEGLDVNRRPDAKRLLMYQLFTTETLTMPLSMLAALEDATKDLVTREKITLHVIGAAQKEYEGQFIFEEILHLLPALKDLKITLIGTTNAIGDVDDANNSPLAHGIECGGCPNCSKAGKTRRAALYRGLYHEYAKTELYSKPDLAVLFHSGRSQVAQASWKPTTEFLLKSGTLTLCTTYNRQEAMEEAAELEELRARFVVRPDVNKWRSLVPCPELMDDQEHAVYYHNYYRYIFQGTV